MESFDTKINNFGGWNLTELLLSLYKKEFNDSLSPFNKKIQKNKVRYQNLFLKKLQGSGT